MGRREKKGKEGSHSVSNNASNRFDCWRNETRCIKFFWRLHLGNCLTHFHKIAGEDQITKFLEHDVTPALPPTSQPKIILLVRNCWMLYYIKRTMFDKKNWDICLHFLSTYFCKHLHCTGIVFTLLVLKLHEPSPLNKITSNSSKT